MKVKFTISLVLVLFVQQVAKSQVWYPEGVFTHNTPSLIKVDHQVITISKAGFDVTGTKSFWQVSINNGKIWERLPLLVLSKTAEITDMIRCQGSIYVSGNFLYEEGGTTNALVKFDPLVGKWQGLAKFLKVSQPASITTLDVQDNQLILGGNFVNIVNVKNNVNDTISYLSRYLPKVAEFAHYFDNCKRCDPDGAIIDIASNDSIVAISGAYSKIANHKSYSLVRIFKGTVFDTFTTVPKMMEKLAIDGHTIYATAGLLKDKRMFMITKTITDINYNLDSSLFINEILMHEGKLVANGGFYLAGSVPRMSIVKLDGSKWVDISNNYRNAHYIASGRSALFAIGNPELPISVWNPNKSVVRFFPGLSLVKIKIFLDVDNDCVMDKEEKPVPKQYIGLNNRGAFTNENGMAEFLMPNIISNTQSFVIKPPRNYISSLCARDTVTKTIIPGRYYDSTQFALVRLPNINDIRVTISSPKGQQVIKNKRVTYNIAVENVGSNTISGKVRLKKNPNFSTLSTDPPAKAIDGSTYEWGYTLLAGQTQMKVYTGLADDSIFNNNMEFQAMASASISTGSSQYTEDDVDSIPQLVEGTINPFRKDVYPTPAPGDSITYLNIDDRELRYQISFNNFSNDTVYYAVVIDTLDLNLDMSYIQETGSNELYYTEVQSDPNNQYKGILIWHFPNIKLTPNPTMNFEILSSGSYIGFKVVTKPLTNGIKIKNVASVFYDNEYAGTTNAVYCTVAINGIDEFNNEDDKFKIYPNPFNREVTLGYDFKEGDVISVYNTNGQVVYHCNVNETTSNKSIDLDSLGSGIYVVQVFSHGQLIQRKMLKL